MTQIERLKAVFHRHGLILSVVCVASAAGISLASYKYGRSIEHRHMQSLLDQTAAEIADVKHQVEAWSLRQSKISDDFKAEMDRATMILRAWEINRQFDREWTIYRLEGSLMDELEVMMIKKDFGTKLPATIAAEWKPKREALDTLERRSLDDFISARVTWERDAKKLGITATFKEALDLPSDRVIDKRVLELRGGTFPAQGAARGP